MKTDLEGDTIWTNCHPFPSTANSIAINDITYSNSGHFVGTGRYSNPLNPAIEGGQVLLFKIDTLGNEIWTKWYGQPEKEQNGVQVIEMPDESIIVAGQSNNVNGPEKMIQVLRTTPQGDTLWAKSIGAPSLDYELSSIAPINEEHFFLWGHKTTPFEVVLIKMDTSGNLLWEKKLFPDLSSKNIIPSSDGNFFATTSYTLLKIDSAGNVLLNSDLPHVLGSDHFLIETNDEGAAAISIKTIPNAGINICLMKMDAAGNTEWIQNFGGPGTEGPSSIIQTSDGGFAIIGFSWPANGEDAIYLIRTDTAGNSWTNHIQGHVLYDSISNCTIDMLEPFLKGWSVTASNANGNTFYGTTDSDGHFDILTDTGTYTLHLNIPNAYWSSCWNDSIVSMTSFFDTVSVEFLAQAEHECPIINVDVSTPFLRRCFDNTYYVSYCNEGTVPVADGYIEVEFDEWLTVNSSSHAWSSQDGQTFTFEIDTLDVGECGGFQVNTTLDCDSTMLGQTHCVIAHSYPDSICLPVGTQWDGSTVAVEGVCENDTIKFTLKNVGDDDMSQPLNYIVIEDHILHLNESFQLVAGDSTRELIAATGATYRMEAEQSVFHPTNSAPSVTVEGCAGNNQPINLGFFGAYSEDDADPFISIDCQQNIGSYDLNDKQGFPKGIGPDHIIFHDTELEYLIRFQNTGTDTAFLVVIRDTLSEFLDPSSVVPGASSHPYTWELRNNGALKFTFDDIMLVDSNANEPASHGFVKFRIKQQLGNLPGTVIHNQAAIYFDFNAPVITNQTDHKIDDRPLIVDSLTIYFCDQELYQEDTVINSVGSTLSYHFETTNTIILAEPQMTVIDTTLQSGDSLYGVLYEADTTLIQQLISVAGCDSTVTIHIEVMPNSARSLEWLETKVSAYPNPSNGEVNLAIDLSERMELEIEVLTPMGQKVLAIPKQSYSTDKQIVPIILTDLPDGVYWLNFNNQNGRKVVKLIKNSPD